MPIEAGSGVKCACCGKETTVSFVTDRKGINGYDLGCFHRNAVCPTCGELVRDVSERIEEVIPACRQCSPDLLDDYDE